MSPPTATIDRTPALGRPSPALVPLQPGDRVDVRNRFDGRWTTGFRVDAVVADDDGYRFKLRRLSDGAVLPVLFDEDTVVGVR